MTDTFITKIQINESRNISNFTIELSETERKHLIITGKNGSGKTSLLNDFKIFFRHLSSHGYRGTTAIYFNKADYVLGLGIQDGKFLVKFFDASRLSGFHTPTGIQKIHLHKNDEIDQNQASTYFVQHIVNLKADKLFAKDDGETEVVKRIDEWFNRFENSLRHIFDSPNLILKFDRKNYNFEVIEEGKLPYNLNTLSSGYSAILSIISEIIMRMEAHESKAYDLEGVVLIDEIETHLHVDLQKKILPFLIDFFPKIQFIVTTHSPFVLSSISNAVICDLEKRIVTSDLSGYSYDTLIESYFDSNKYSILLNSYIDEYETLSDKDDLTDKERDRFFELKMYLDQIPKFISDELAVKLQQIKLKKIGGKKER